MQSAQAGLAAAEAELTRAQAEEARQSALLKDGFTTKQRYDTAVRDLQTAEAQRDSAQAKLTLARENLGYTELHSEVDGIVTAVYAEAGQVVAAGQHVLRVAEPREREAVFDVPEVAFRLVPHDPEVEVTLVADPAVKVVGRVRYTAPQADPTTRTYAVRGLIAQCATRNAARCYGDRSGRASGAECRWAPRLGILRERRQARRVGLRPWQWNGPAPAGHRVAI
jgi:RND family efflux transporter MFP subunit